LKKKETNVGAIHFLGAGFAFLGLYIYCVIQTFISFKLSKILHSSKNILLFRLAIILMGFFVGIIGI
jgi:hypothetical protein